MDGLSSRIPPDSMEPAQELVVANQAKKEEPIGPAASMRLSNGDVRTVAPAEEVSSKAVVDPALLDLMEGIGEVGTIAEKKGISKQNESSAKSQAPEVPASVTGNAYKKITPKLISQTDPKTAPVTHSVQLPLASIAQQNKPQETEAPNTPQLFVSPIPITNGGAEKLSKAQLNEEALEFAQKATGTQPKAPSIITQEEGSVRHLEQEIVQQQRAGASTDPHALMHEEQFMANSALLNATTVLTKVKQQKQDEANSIQFKNAEVRTDAPVQAGSIQSAQNEAEAELHGITDARSNQQSSPSAPSNIDKVEIDPFQNVKKLFEKFNLKNLVRFGYEQSCTEMANINNSATVLCKQLANGVKIFFNTVTNEVFLPASSVKDYIDAHQPVDPKTTFNIIEDEFWNHFEKEFTKFLEKLKEAEQQYHHTIVENKIIFKKPQTHHARQEQQVSHINEVNERAFQQRVKLLQKQLIANLQIFIQEQRRKKAEENKDTLESSAKKSQEETKRKRTETLNQNTILENTLRDQIKHQQLSSD